ncbi:MAG: hypothetical protein WCO29_01525 [Nostocales cyanobacterium ELA583]
MSDSEALLQAVRLKLGGCERSLFRNKLELRSSKIGVVVSDRCLGMWGGRSFKIGVVCDSEALRRNRCLGMLGCDRLKLGLCAIGV